MGQQTLTDLACLWIQDNFKTGTVLQLVSRSSGKSLQLVDGSVNGLGSPEADAPENSTYFIICHCISNSHFLTSLINSTRNELILCYK